MIVNIRCSLGLLFLAGLCFCRAVYAAPIAVDEFGNGLGTIGNGFIGNDPGPGGLNNVLIYHLPFAGVQGDVLISSGSEGVNDVVRFNGNSTLIFYSDNIGGFDAPADTLSPPGALYRNVVGVLEVGPEGNNEAFYTPTSGQPGFNASGPTYRFVSDGVLQAVPEPSSSLMFGTGLLGLLGYGWRKRKLKG